MSHYCSECHAYWWPYQTQNGTCPQCSSGTKRSYERADEDAAQRHREALARKRSRELHEQFEVYYAEREARRSAV